MSILLKMYFDRAQRTPEKQNCVSRFCFNQSKTICLIYAQSRQTNFLVVQKLTRIK